MKESQKSNSKPPPLVYGRLRLAGQKNTAPRLAANALFYPMIGAHEKAQVFAAGRANAAQHQKLLAERARLIPTFHMFRSLVLEDLREAYSEDRINRTRAAKNRRMSWMALYKPFAALRDIDKALVIRALADIMKGGYGNDTYVVDNAGDQVIESAVG